MVAASVCPQAPNTRGRTACCRNRTHGFIGRIFPDGPAPCVATVDARKKQRFVKLLTFYWYSRVDLASTMLFSKIKKWIYILSVLWNTHSVVCKIVFVGADTDRQEPYDWQYCRYLAERHGVIGIPSAPFFSRDDYSSHYRIPSLARFAFCKRDETLLEATRRLRVSPQEYLASPEIVT